jgi:hypothetical protein
MAGDTRCGRPGVVRSFEQARIGGETSPAPASEGGDPVAADPIAMVRSNLAGADWLLDQVIDEWTPKQLRWGQTTQRLSFRRQLTTARDCVHIEVPTTAITFCVYRDTNDYSPDVLTLRWSE